MLTSSYETVVCILIGSILNCLCLYKISVYQIYKFVIDLVRLFKLKFINNSLKDCISRVDSFIYLSELA